MTTIERNNKNLVFDFLRSLNTDHLYITDHVTLDDIHEHLTFDELTELIEDKNGFDVDIIYYGNAMEYLSENDPSLHKSLGIAAELCYNTEDLSSEVLASLLASQNCREEWNDLKNEIDSFLLDLEWNEEETEA